MTPLTQALLREAKQEIASKHNFDTWDEADMIDYKAFPKMIEEVAVEFHTRLLAEAGRDISGTEIVDILSASEHEKYDALDYHKASNLLRDYFSALLAAKQAEIESLKEGWSSQISNMQSQLEAAQKEADVHFQESERLRGEKSILITANVKLQMELQESKAEVERLAEKNENQANLIMAYKKALNEGTKKSK